MEANTWNSAPNTAIAMAEDTGSAAISLFSVDESTHAVQDTVPPAHSLSILDRFTSVTERINLALPPSNITGDPTTVPSILPFFFNYPSSTPWYGFNIQISVDSRFTTWLRDYSVYNGLYITPSLFRGAYESSDIQGDNTYYWRVRPVYTATNIKGAWSLPWRIERNGFVPVLSEVS